MSVPDARGAPQMWQNNAVPPKQFSRIDMPRCPVQNAEIFTLTYGSIVRQLIADFEDLDEVNKQLEKM